MSNKFLESEMRHLENFISDWDSSQSVQINLSSSFLVKSRCKFCVSGPKHYVISKLSTKWIDHSMVKDRFAAYVKRLKRFNYDFYLSVSPKVFNSINFLTHTVFYKGYNPALHKNVGVPAAANYMEYLTCNCGLTQWGFAQKSAASRPEIVLRKAKYNYPRKFDYQY
jgi:hypothetical protein